MTRAMYVASLENPATRDRVLNINQQNNQNKSRERSRNYLLSPVPPVCPTDTGNSHQANI